MNIEPLVLVISGEPLASSFVIAEGMKQQHASTMRLIKRHQTTMERFGLVRFEIRPRLRGQHGGGDAEYAMLNEMQSALLISLMRNTEDVVAFKAGLIAEFYRMRDALNQRSQNLYQQLQALVAEEVETKVKASFGSHLMLERKRAIPDLKHRREQIESEIQPSLFLH